MKFNKQYLFYILAIIGVVGTILVYTNVYSNYNEQTENLKKETSVLKEEISKLEAQAKEMEKYEQEMKQMNAEMAGLMNYFATYYQMDDIVRMMYDMQDEYNYKKVDYLKEISVKTTTPELKYSTGTTSTLPTYGLYGKSIDFGVTTTYKGMKDSIQYIIDSDTLNGVSEITFSFDKGTGLLKGNIVYNQFFLTGTGKPYVDPFFPNVETGTENLFGETAAFDEKDWKDNYQDLETE